MPEHVAARKLSGIRGACDASPEELRYEIALAMAAVSVPPSGGSLRRGRHSSG
jgi:hypothetical protein